MQKIRFLLVSVILFALGAYVWRVKSHGLSDFVPEVPSEAAGPLTDVSGHPVLFEVGKDTVTEADIEWEYRMTLNDLADLNSKGSFSIMGSEGGEDLMPLKKKIASGLVERKILFSFMQRDTSFDARDPARFVNCLGEWQAILQRQTGSPMNAEDRNRLKSRLCERSLLDQYMGERLFKGIVISEDEILTYYREHKSQLRQYEAVTIRHILFVDEPTARKWRGHLTVQNFSDLAKAHSITPEGKTGGRLGPYRKGMLPAVFDTAFTMKVGEISDVVRSNYGYHVMLLEEKVPPKMMDLTKSRPEIRKILYKKKKEEAYDKWLEQALASVKVLANKEAL